MPEQGPLVAWLAAVNSHVWSLTHPQMSQRGSWGLNQTKELSWELQPAQKNPNLPQKQTKPRGHSQFYIKVEGTPWQQSWR
jgi:hypothetical protein